VESVLQKLLLQNALDIVVVVVVVVVITQPAALLLSSVVQVEEVCDCSRVVPQVLHCKLCRMALTVEQMLYGVWCHSTLRTDV